MRILIVEDDFVSRKVLTKFLAPYGDSDMAVNGVEAIEAFSGALATDRCYGLICLDILMPGMNGLEVLRIIREMEKGAGILPPDEVKIIITTSLRPPKDVFDTATHGGCTRYLAKPVDRKVLLMQLKDFGIEEL
jgi:two-component system, chemotaxis family, chemotaxis protein CheY